MYFQNIQILINVTLIKIKGKKSCIITYLDQGLRAIAFLKGCIHKKKSNHSKLTTPLITSSHAIYKYVAKYLLFTLDDTSYHFV